MSGGLGLTFFRMQAEQAKHEIASSARSVSVRPHADRGNAAANRLRDFGVRQNISQVGNDGLHLANRTGFGGVSGLDHAPI